LPERTSTSPRTGSYAITDARADLFPLGIVLTELLLGKNIFRSSDRAQSRRNILGMSIPLFATLRPEIEPRLEAIIQRALVRDREKRYQSAADMLTDLELYLYSDRYGPTNEKLGVYLKDLFGVRDPVVPSLSSRPPI
jgi:serine/threonine-protein kinase